MISTPQIKIYDGQGNPIKFGGIDISEFITDFEYTYITGTDPDECEITFGIHDEVFMDIPQLGRRRPLIVEWGYEGNFSARRTIGIKDRETKYKYSGVSLMLSCISWVGFLEDQRDKNPDSVLDKMFDALKEGWKLSYEIPGNLERLELRYKDAKANKNPDVANIKRKRTPGFAKPTSHMLYVQGLGPAPPLKTDTYTEKFFNDISDPDKSALTKGQSLADGINLILQEYNDSLLVDSRDNELAVRVRNLDGIIVRTYTWKGGNGELLSVDLSTNEKSSTGNSQTVISIDPDTKEITGIKVSSNSFSDRDDLPIYFRLGHEAEMDDDGLRYKYDNGTFYVQKLGVDSDYSAEQKAKISWDPNIEGSIIENQVRIEQLKTALDRELSGENIISNIGKNLQKLALPDFDTLKVYEDTYQKHVENLTPESNEFWFRRELGLIKEEDWFDKNMIGSNVHSPEELIAQATRMTVEDQLSRNQGSISVIGDPSLTNNLNIALANLSSSQNGKYYVEEIRHSINQSGYICELELIKVPNSYATVKSSYKKKIQERWEKVRNEAIDHNRNEFEKLNLQPDDPLLKYIKVIEANKDTDND